MIIPVVIATIVCVILAIIYPVGGAMDKWLLWIAWSIIIVATIIRRKRYEA